MSKAHLVVLGFLNTQPMHGYQIGQIVSERRFSIWAGIKLPSVYKAMQVLENKSHIHGEQVTDGNNPPRTVYSLTSRGRKYLKELLTTYLDETPSIPQDFWLALSFTSGIFSQEELLAFIDRKIGQVSHRPNCDNSSHCDELIRTGQAPFIHKHIVNMGYRIHKAALKTLKELREDILSGNHEHFFTDQGRQK